MLSETTLMRTLRSMDNPWHRLPWTLPTALLIWTMAFWGLSFFMGKPNHRPMAPSPIDAQLLEQPFSPTNANMYQPKPLPPVMPLPSPVLSRLSPSTEQQMPIQKSESTTNTARAIAAAAAPIGSGSYRGNMDATSGACAILRPMPQ